MPFVDGSGAPLGPLPLLYRGGRDFQVTEAFAWIDPRDGRRWEVPAHDPERPPGDPGNGTDLASVPPFLWGLIASYGRQTLPAILHDALDDRARRIADTARERLELRREADGVFRAALREQGVTDLRATTMWATVALERHLRFAPVRFALLVAHVLASVASAVLAVGLTASGQPPALALLLVPLLLALPWGRDADLAIAAGYLGALYAPLVVVAALSSALEFGIALVVWLLRGRRGARPRPGPAIRAR